MAAMAAFGGFRGFRESLMFFFLALLLQGQSTEIISLIPIYS